MRVQKTKQFYDGKTKKLYETDQSDQLILEFKDVAVALDGKKTGIVQGKGEINNQVSNHLLEVLETKRIPTHYVQQLSNTETVVKRLEMFPIEVIIRNIAAGTLAERLDIPEGTKMKHTILEYSYKRDDLGDPMLNDYHIIAMDFATREELHTIAEYSFEINAILTPYLRERGIELVDFKIEYGKLPDGTIVLADEISPDTCRFWDIKSGEKLDQDRFRRDLGNVEQAYEEIFNRLLGK